MTFIRLVAMISSFLMLVTEARSMNTTSLNETYPVVGTIFPGIFIGSKWCGPGNIAQSIYNIGPKPDECCKYHDLCKHSIPAGTTKYKLTNNGLWTQVSCQCDHDFVECLRHAHTVTAYAVLFLYGVFKEECFLTINCAQFRSWRCSRVDEEIADHWDRVFIHENETRQFFPDAITNAINLITHNSTILEMVNKGKVKPIIIETIPSMEKEENVQLRNTNGIDERPTHVGITLQSSYAIVSIPPLQLYQPPQLPQYPPYYPPQLPQYPPYYPPQLPQYPPYYPPQLPQYPQYPAQRQAPQQRTDTCCRDDLQELE